MENSIASESLTQRGRSALFNDLVSLCQSSQETLLESSNSSIKVLSSLRKIGFDKALINIVKKHMNISLSRINFAEESFPNAMCVLYTTKFASQDRYKSQTLGQVLEKINLLYNDKEAYLSKDLDKKSPLGFYMEITTSWWTLKEKDSYFFTPEEIASIILHELGHIDHFIRQYGRCYYRMIDAADIINYTIQTPSLDIIKSILEDLNKSKYLNKEWRQVLVTTQDYFNKSNSVDDISFYEALSSLSTLATAEAAWYSLSILSDELVTDINQVDMERAADEFSSRNGAYQALSSALSKVYSLTDKNSYYYYKQFLWSAPATVFSLLNKFESLFNISAEEITGTYDPLIRRLELIVETAKHAFSQLNLSEEAKKDIKNQINSCESYIKDYRSTKQYKMRIAIKSWLNVIGKTNRLIFAPFHNRLTKNYERLQQATRSISRNPFYYLSDEANS